MNNTLDLIVVIITTSAIAIGLGLFINKYFPRHIPINIDKEVGEDIHSVRL